MHRPTVSNHRLAIAAAALAVLALVGCMAPEERAGADAVNADRASFGLGALVANEASVAKAQGWAVQLAGTSGGVCSTATLSHSILTVGAPNGWISLGENVACRSTPGTIAGVVSPLEAQLLASPGHRANILNAAYTDIGIGMAAVPMAGQPGWIVVFETQEFARI